MESKYIALEKEYIKYGYKFTQVKREGLVAIYKQEDDESGSFIGYEVFEIIEKEAGFAGPKKYPQPAKELVPNTELWGSRAFSCWTLEQAEEKFVHLQQQMANRIKK